MLKKFWMGLITVLCAIAVTITVNYAWFINGYDVDPLATGSSTSAYYYSGDGSIDDPFVITTPRHLYNLAWLQYLGSYNQETYYFQLGDPDNGVSCGNNGELDMTGWVLPPIGTDTNPFIGSFNGNHITITHLTTSNKLTDFNGKPKPSTINETTGIQNCGNMGFFGNIGPTSGTASVTNIVGNFYLKDNIVKTQTSANGKYFGAVAGYVNATLENVGVISGTLTNASATTVSEYSVVGYATSTYLTALNKKSTIIYNPTTTNTNKYTYQGKGTATGWGGSIDMLSMYNTLKSEWNTIVNTNGGAGAITYPTAITTTYSNNGSTSEAVTNTSVFGTTSMTGNNYQGYTNVAVPSNYVYTSTSSSGYFIRFYDVSKSTTIGGNTYKTSSYSLLIEKPNNVGDSEWQYMCLTGYADRQVQNALTYTYTYPNAYYLTDSTNYLTYNSTTTLKNVTSTTTASKWYYDSSGYYWTFESYGTNAQTKYYLTDNNTGYPVLSSTPTTKWSFSSNALKSDNNNYLVYEKEDGEWILKSTSTNTLSGYKISYNGSFLAKNGNTGINTSGVTENNATVWFVNSSNQIYTYGDTTEYYLRATSKNGTNITLGTSTNYRYTKNNNKIYRTRNNTNYYLRYANNAWEIATDNSNNALTWTESSMDVTFKLNRTSVSNTTSSNNNSHFTTPNTYFPLQATEGVPDDKNTGYVVSGANYFSDSYGDIRVSGYPISDSLGNAGGASLTTVYTIDSSKNPQTIVGNNIDNSSDYVRFSSAYKSMKKVLSDSNTNGNIDGTPGYVYGLHFMNATIGLTTQSQEVRIPYAKINGDEYYNYQVPYDCIDFNLKDKGYITFFAGTYYTGNLSFFSLYEIYRDTSNICNIAAIAEIEEIYSNPDNPDSYVYKLKVNNQTKYSVPFKYQTSNGQYVYDSNNRKIKVNLDDTPYTHSYSGLLNSKPSGYTNTVFKTQSIKAQNSLTDDACFYFEIPVNDGEYCLGSVPGSNGAYLMYLDIGANATEVYRTEITQKTTITTETYTYPSGVAIIGSTSDSIKPRDSAVAKITSSGDHAISVSGTTIIVVGASDSSYINPDVTLKKSQSETVNSSGTSPTSSTISQLMIVDYVKSDSISTYVTLITDETGKNRTSEYYLLEGNGVLDGWGLFKTPTNELDAIVYTTDNSEFSINVSNSNTQKEKHYYYSTSGAETTTTLKMLTNNGTEQDDGKYYGCSGDNIYITTDETIKVYVTQKDNLTYYFFFNLDLGEYPYPSNQQAVPSYEIDDDENYQYEFTNS